MFSSIRTQNEKYRRDDGPCERKYSLPDNKQRRNPRLLFLAYAFPPARKTSSVRSGNIAKHLARRGWDVTVVTPDPSLWRHIDDTKKAQGALFTESIHRITTGHSHRFLNPPVLKCSNGPLGWFVGGVCRRVRKYFGIDKAVGWLRHVNRACASLKSDDVDVIFATGAPFVSFEAAKQLSKRLGKPYVLDYRDPWTGNPHENSSNKLRIIRKETKLLRDCAAATIVSPSWAAAMQRRFPLESKLHVITNGYDPEELSDIKSHDFGHFAIVYTGIFHPPKRVITPIFAALKLLKEQCSDQPWRFHYYGDHENHIREEGQRAGIMDRVSLHGYVPREEALAAVRGAGLSVVITSVEDINEVADHGIVPGKLFECLGMRSPTLVITPPGSDIAVMAKTTTLLRCCTGTNVHAIASLIRERMQERDLETTGCDAYTWPSIARKLDKILRGVMERKTGESHLM
jgi:glycosyltransferase involved in cell wall biosynthesis